MPAERPWWIAAALGFGALFAAGAGLWWWQTSPHGAMERQARAALANVLFDPDSAQLRNLRRGETAGICGEVNGKNRFGAYVGYRPFYVTGDLAFIEEEEPSRLLVSFVGTQCRGP